ncbi:TPA: PepSY-associated TM helix domain-containing protein [Stenotrophomonas maltophilia]|uniref:PepSY-associated TM helix domain-containing protein n=1 Tax=Stenotrophomonas maltophilia TaxID=40324 RepID=UPI0031B8C08E|nr:PepSY-associated TM helix domain-containing protein [Stenotrophomonas maltophilia]HDS1024945.1 PepSY-associated TM helix domain-containing protein [Stenotrophomonas maltophilia]HDS1028474.1 PepSY-associated TM helix domain-containing protein [Stenotrophomonas maltophilia]HDS1035654.1 PepSY-associated TM helix domain-containing protein [Stenotrophomonas maltophilia]HDS1039601.1 PepSY-associated TM helix domain-containing protein [Stenotrophomonas maltophilia]
MSRPASSTVQQQQSRGFWLRTLHQWHWISSAVCLIGMLLFAVTGLTLNHAAKIEAKPQVQNQQLELPAALLGQLGDREDGNAPIPRPARQWLDAQLGIAIGGRPAEWSAEEIYLSLPRPGGDAWLSIDRESGAVEYESTSRGAVSYLNDLHKGRNAGPAWGWFLDLFAVACLVFCITGLFLLHLHARQRRMTWPLVGLGLMIPLLIALLLIH